MKSMNIETAAWMKAAGFTVYEEDAVEEVTTWRGHYDAISDQLITLPNNATPSEAAAAIHRAGQQQAKRRIVKAKADFDALLRL